MILGIDYGRAKIGLAIADSTLAEPLEVLRISSIEDAISKIKKKITDKGIQKIVIGISEGEMAREQTDFANKLSLAISVPISMWDEGLSTYEAQQKAHSAGIHGKKLQNLEDAFAAAIMLQSYLDLNPKSK